MAIDFSASHKAMDAYEHARTYRGFIRVTISCTIVILATLALMAFFLL